MTMRIPVRRGRLFVHWGIRVRVATEPLWDASHNGSYGQSMILGSRVARGGGRRAGKQVFLGIHALISLPITRPPSRLTFDSYRRVDPCNSAMSLSGTVNRPRLSDGGVTFSMASIFSVGSIRR